MWTAGEREREAMPNVLNFFLGWMADNGGDEGVEGESGVEVVEVLTELDMLLRTLGILV